MKRLVLFFVTTLLISACAQPAPESNSGFTYAVGSTIPVDTKVYTLVGQVAGDVNSLVRQTSPATARLTSVNGSAYGSFYGPEMSGKGMVRLFVHASDAKIAPSESIVILKMEDTKGIALLPGDIVTVKCRAQFESLSATIQGQKFDESAGTWELDYCRMETPEVRLGK